MKQRAKEYFKGHDMFGHTINLNFDKQGDTHNTLIGGFGSFILKIAIFFYVCLNVKKMILNEQDEINTEDLKVNLDDLGP